MSGQYIRFPSLGGTTIAQYTTLSAFPATAAGGTLAIAADTDILYIYNTGSASWVVVGPGSGGGTVTGPLSSLNNELTVFNGTSGTQITGFSTGTAGIAHLASTGVVSCSLIVNADVSSSAAIAYSKLNLTGDIVDADINASAAIEVSKLAALTASRAVASDASGFLVSATTTATELGYVHGVTSAIQTQLNALQPSGSYITALTGDVTASGPGSAVATLAATSNGTLTTLSALTTASSLATVGTISSGTWAGTTISVFHGGTGLTSTTAYAVLCGGTTSSGALQSIASVGTSGQVLTSNGAGALPTFQAVPTSVTTVGSLDGQSAVSAGLDIVGNTIYAQSATSSKPGLINNSNQTLGSGNKTFGNDAYILGKTCFGTGTSYASSIAGSLYSVTASSGITVTNSSLPNIIVESDGSTGLPAVGFISPTGSASGLIFNEGTTQAGAQFRYLWSGTASTSSFQFLGNGHTTLGSISSDGWWRIGSSTQLPMVVSAQPASAGLQIVRGTVKNDGTNIGGEGFTCTKDSTGLFSVTFSTAMLGNSVGSVCVVATPIYDSGIGGTPTVNVKQYYTSGSNTTGFQIQVIDSGLVNEAFNFIAIGQRSA